MAPMNHFLSKSHAITKMNDNVSINRISECLLAIINK